VISLAILLFQITFGDIRIHSDDGQSSTYEAIERPVGAYSDEAFALYTARLKSLLDDTGYWYADISILRAEIDSSTSRIHIDLRIDAKEQVRIGFLKLDGAKIINEAYVLRVMRFEADKPATRAELERLQGRIQQTGFYRTIDDPRLITIGDADGVLFKVEERSQSRTDVLLGYTRNELIGQVDLQFRHLFSPGSRFDVKFERMQPLQTRLISEIGYRNLYGGLRLYQQDSTYFSRSWTLGADLDLDASYSIGAWVEQQVTSVGTAPASLGITDGSRLLTGLRMRWNSAQGSNAIVSAGTGFRDGNRVNTGEIGWMMLRPTSGRIIWAWMGEAGAQVSKVTIAPDNQYRFGGALSFRGYREDELQAQRFVWTEIEPRYRLDAETYAFLFAGVASTPIRNSLFNAGIGFSYDTRLGPLRFTYAGSSDRGILQGVVHFSLSSGL
jgi:outer membrane translocation and assembly module TamA